MFGCIHVTAYQDSFNINTMASDVAVIETAAALVVIARNISNNNNSIKIGSENSNT